MMRIAVLISGGGTTARRIMDECTEGCLRDLAEVGAVIASNSEAGGITRALEAGIDPRDIVVLHPSHYTPERFGEEIIRFCSNRGITFIGQYGWLVKTPANVINWFGHRIVNQHPGPLDPPYMDFGGKGMYGMRVHQAVLSFTRRIDRPFLATEATAHHVTEQYDRGALIATRVVQIEPDDTAETLQQRVLPCEHALQVEVVQSYANNCVPSFERANRLIQEDERDHWLTARREASRLYPHG